MKPNKCKEEQTGRFGDKGRGICVPGRNFLSRRDIWKDTEKPTIYTPQQQQRVHSVPWVALKKRLGAHFFCIFPLFNKQWRWVMSHGYRGIFIDNEKFTKSQQVFSKTQSMLVSFLKLSLLFCLKLWVAMRPVVAVLIEHNYNWALVVKWGSERDH